MIPYKIKAFSVIMGLLSCLVIGVTFSLEWVLYGGPVNQGLIGILLIFIVLHVCLTAYKEAGTDVIAASDYLLSGKPVKVVRKEGEIQVRKQDDKYVVTSSGLYIVFENPNDALLYCPPGWGKIIRFELLDE